MTRQRTLDALRRRAFQLLRHAWTWADRVSHAEEEKLIISESKTGRK